MQYTQKDDNNYSIIDTRNSYTTHVRLILPSTVTATTGITTIMLIPYDISTVYVLTLSNFPSHSIPLLRGSEVRVIDGVEVIVFVMPTERGEQHAHV